MLLLDDYCIGFFKGLIRRGHIASAHQEGIQAIRFVSLLWRGLFLGNGRLLLSRFTFEILQTVLGFIISQLAIWFRSVRSVSFFNHVTILEGGGWGSSVCFGSHILLHPNEKADITNPVLQHEFGHTFQSHQSGPLYLLKYGIPSLLTDNTAWMECDANTRVEKYLNRDHVAIQAWQSSAFHQRLLSEEVRPKAWEYVLFFLGIGVILIPILNFRKGQ